MQNGGFNIKDLWLKFDTAITKKSQTDIALSEKKPTLKEEFAQYGKGAKEENVYTCTQAYTHTHSHTHVPMHIHVHINGKKSLDVVNVHILVPWEKLAI